MLLSSGTLVLPPGIKTPPPQCSKMLQVSPVFAWIREAPLCIQGLGMLRCLYPSEIWTAIVLAMTGKQASLLDMPVIHIAHGYQSNALCFWVNGLDSPDRAKDALVFFILKVPGYCRSFLFFFGGDSMFPIDYMVCILYVCYIFIPLLKYIIFFSLSLPPFILITIVWGGLSKENGWPKNSHDL